LFVHEEKSVLVLAEEFEGFSNIRRNVGNVLDFVLRIVIAKGIFGGCHDLGLVGRRVLRNSTSAAPAARIRAVYTSVREVRLFACCVITTKTNQDMLVVIWIEVLDRSIEILWWQIGCTLDK
jgi:hypothetical protein